MLIHAISSLIPALSAATALPCQQKMKSHFRIDLVHLSTATIRRHHCGLQLLQAARMLLRCSHDEEDAREMKGFLGCSGVERRPVASPNTFIDMVMNYITAVIQYNNKRKRCRNRTRR
ncbi:hypothetical protein BKA56DRAFT_598557 [Ilyonectria sp. MPI-CAGE-AT-0026]|nr:hypothetical protein BKA56DRAFT_598557 [Ilyonectria sp. MPI-CAGE-AT-0026]